MNYSRYLRRLLIAAFGVAGCTSSFEPRLHSHDITKNRLPTVKRTQAGVQVSVEEFFSPQKSRRAFDTDLGSQSILPLLVRVENEGTETYKLQQSQIRASLDGQQLSLLYPHEAASRGASRDAAWNALVNTAAMGPFAMYWSIAGLALSAQQTKNVNRQIEQHFESLELQDSLLKPDDTTAGFIYFYLPGSTKRLENLMLEITLESDPAEDQAAKKLFYRLHFPTIETH
jgi:hypothetical protein